MPQITRDSLRNSRTAGKKDKRHHSLDSPDTLRETKKQVQEEGLVDRRIQQFLHYDSAPSGSQIITTTSSKPIYQDTGRSTMNIDKSPVTSNITPPHTKQNDGRTSEERESNVTTMSSVMDNFDVLFTAAISTPQYTNAMREVFKPMFAQMANEIKAEIKTDIANSIRVEFKEVKDTLEKQKSETETLKQDLHRIRNINHEVDKDLQYLYDSKKQHDRFLESLDFERRKNNIIAIGIPEESALTHHDSVANTDEEKVSLVLKALDIPAIEISAIDRLGKIQTQDQGRPRCRPVKITLKDHTCRKTVLDASWKLKNQHDQNNSLGKIFLKKDTHPGIRRETNRLLDVVKSEKTKPENTGHNVWYDWRERTVKIDNQVIDHYQPTFF